MRPPAFVGREVGYQVPTRRRGNQSRGDRATARRDRLGGVSSTNSWSERCQRVSRSRNAVFDDAVIRLKCKVSRPRVPRDRSSSDSDTPPSAVLRESGVGFEQRGEGVSPRLRSGTRSPGLRAAADLGKATGAA